MSLVATVKMVNLGYYGSFSVGMLCGAHFMFGEDSPMMMSYWKSSNITGAGAEATNWGFRLVACVTLAPRPAARPPPLKKNKQTKKSAPHNPPPQDPSDRTS